MNLSEFTYYYDILKKRSFELDKYNWIGYDQNGAVQVSEALLKAKTSSKYNINNTEINNWFYHPITLAQAALGFYDLYVETNEDQFKKNFLDQIEWLEKNAVEHNGTLVFPFPFDYIDLKKGWVSGMAQGEILSCFVRVYLITHQNKYLEIAEKLYKSFWTPLGEKYGFMNKDKFGLWFEEIPSYKKYHHVLNGYIYAIWGIYDYFKLTQRDDLLSVWNTCVDTLENALPEYDIGYWSLYDFSGTLASYFYHEKVHIPQLKALNKITDKDIFRDYAIKWEKYNTSMVCRTRKKIYAFKGMLRSKRK